MGVEREQTDFFLLAAINLGVRVGTAAAILCHRSVEHKDIKYRAEVEFGFLMALLNSPKKY